MKTETYNLIDAINRENINNSQWGMCSDVQDTAAYFGTKESIELQGDYLYVYRQRDTYFSFIREENCGLPAHTLTMDDGNTFIDLYEL